MANPTDTTDVDDGADSLWMGCRPGGDVLVRWEELTPQEQQAAWDYHNKTFGAAEKETVE